ncbi:hypothetical protein G6O67_001474 [Ophiocordyceps sinensis]|uniref:Uncharacterized protein n=2 Tax=Ophiocordyceps sinensis TaxID=72228 RepID=A0A8H4V952_9HYPO|nr:hypothetical protein OCS_06502 [Ophiocordyceps sinensis CO18]KAF4512316.1 hypothetical protein G6O67_001474 [Ophiocordyceps sinensis]
MVEQQAPGERAQAPGISSPVDRTRREPGKVHFWQVTGDAECMYQQHTSGVDGFNAESFAWHQALNTNLGHSQFAIADGIRIQSTE